MQMMNFSELRNKKTHTARNRYEQKQSPDGWQVESIAAPFDCLRVYSQGLSHITEVPSIDTITETFINGGGSIARPKMHIPGIGTLITCRDTIGLLFSFIEPEVLVRSERFNL